MLFAIALGDAVFPALPSETAAIVCGIQAARGKLSLDLVLLCAALGAFLGDNTSYAVGRWLGGPVQRRFFTGEKARSRIERARHFLETRGSYVLVIARFIPGVLLIGITIVVAVVSAKSPVTIRPSVRVTMTVSNPVRMTFDGASSDSTR